MAAAVVRGTGERAEAERPLLEHLKAMGWQHIEGARLKELGERGRLPGGAAGAAPAGRPAPDLVLDEERHARRSRRIPTARCGPPCVRPVAAGGQPGRHHTPPARRHAAGAGRAGREDAVLRLVARGAGRKPRGGPRPQRPPGRRPVAGVRRGRQAVRTGPRPLRERHSAGRGRVQVAGHPRPARQGHPRPACLHRTAAGRRHPSGRGRPARHTAPVRPGAAAGRRRRKAGRARYVLLGRAALRAVAQHRPGLRRSGAAGRRRCG